MVARYLLLNRHYGKYLLEDEGAEGTDAFGVPHCKNPAEDRVLPSAEDIWSAAWPRGNCKISRMNLSGSDLIWPFAVLKFWDARVTLPSDFVLDSFGASWRCAMDGGVEGLERQHNSHGPFVHFCGQNLDAGGQGSYWEPENWEVTRPGVLFLKGWVSDWVRLGSILAELVFWGGEDTWHIHAVCGELGLDWNGIRSQGNLSGYISCFSQKFSCKSLTRPFKDFSLLMSVILKSLQTLFLEGQKQPEVVLCTCHCSVQCASIPWGTCQTTIKLKLDPHFTRNASSHPFAETTETAQAVAVAWIWSTKDTRLGPEEIEGSELDCEELMMDHWIQSSRIFTSITNMSMYYM